MRFLIHFDLFYYFPLRFDEKSSCNAEIFAARSVVNLSASFLGKSQGANTKIKLFDVFLWKFETSIKSGVHTYICSEKKILKRKWSEVCWPSKIFMFWWKIFKSCSWFWTLWKGWQLATSMGREECSVKKDFNLEKKMKWSVLVQSSEQNQFTWRK